MTPQHDLEAFVFGGCIQGISMNTEHKFLITYGLQNFVTHNHADGKCTFTIRNQGNHKMIRHAKSLITGSYGETAHIQVA